MKAAIYARVSTKEQKLDNQLPVLESFCKTRGYEISAIYSEQESAWHEGHQKELSRLIKDAEAKNFEIVLVWALDRLTREGATAILTLINRFKKLGIKVLSYQEPWTEAPGEVGDLLYALVGWVANMESKRRSERVKAALKRKKENGGRLGRKPGSKDKHKRKKDGYILRQARDRVKRAENKTL